MVCKDNIVVKNINIVKCEIQVPNWKKPFLIHFWVVPFMKQNENPPLDIAVNRQVGAIARRAFILSGGCERTSCQCL